MSAVTVARRVGALGGPERISAADAALAQREWALPGLSLLLDDAAFTAILADAYPDAGIHAARARYLRLKPSTNCLVAYEVERSAGAARVYARTHPRSDVDKLARVNEAGAAGLLGRGGVLLEKLLIAVYPFPNDRRLPGIAKLFDEETRARLLVNLLDGDPTLASARLEVVRHKPERRLVGVLEAPGGERAVLKAYDRRSYDARRGASTLHSRGHLRVPRTLGESAVEGMLVTEWLPGEPLDAVMAGPGAAAAAAGRALADLHAHPLDGVSKEPVRAEGAALAQAVEAVATICPTLARPAHELAQRLAGQLDGSRRTSEEVLLHGDFSADQVLTTEEGGVSLIDLDESRRGAPAVDVGSFLARLELDALEGRIPPRVVSELAEGLLAGYEDARGRLPSGVRAHTAGALLRLAPEPFRLRRADWPELVAAALDRARELEGRRRPAGVSGRGQGRR